eukprot:snap_masked-scaffold_11-processed-gene-1.35-mRNA-1 protein AED:0.45 eAED:0.45 QI:0/0/0/0.5/1/1/2/0/863
MKSYVEDAISQELLSMKRVLCIFFRGLSLIRIISDILNSFEQHRIIILNGSSIQQSVVEKYPETTCVFTSEISKQKRRALLQDCSNTIFFFTNRIFVVDLLEGIIKASEIDGIIVLNSHNITSEGTIGFIFNLLYNQNRSNKFNGFTYAFSSRAEMCIRETDSILHTIHCDNLSLWPRFHKKINNMLEKSGAKFSEIKVNLSKYEKLIQKNLIICLVYCLTELKKRLRNTKVELFQGYELPQVHNNFSIDKLFTSDFLRILKSVSSFNARTFSLERNNESTKISFVVRNLVEDIRALGMLLNFLLESDAVSFEHLFFEASSQINKAPLWMQTEEANLILKYSRKRVCSLSPVGAHEKKFTISKDKVKYFLEYKPLLPQKVKVLLSLLTTKNSKENKALVMVPNERIEITWKNIIKGNYDRENSVKLFSKQIYVKYATLLSKELNIPLSSLSPQLLKHEVINECLTTIKKRKGRISKLDPENILHILEYLEYKKDKLITETEIIDLVDENEAMNKYSNVSFLSIEKGDEAIKNAIEKIKPQSVFLCVPDLFSLRYLELFFCSEINTDIDLFYLIYKNTFEEAIFKELVEREEKSFKHLIQKLSQPQVKVSFNQGGNMSEIIEELLIDDVETNTILVDVREFRSKLPYQLHKSGLKVIPLTLDIGDYILDDNICIERKSISDLLSSFTSGRLLKQLHSLSNSKFSHICLLVEYFSSLDNIHTNFGATLRTKIVVTLLNFPKCSLVWSPTDQFTAKYFAKIKEETDNEPTQKLIKTLKSKQNEKEYTEDTQFTAINFLLSIPGIDLSNIHLITSQVKNIKELFSLNEPELTNIMKNKAAAQNLYSFVNSPFEAQHKPVYNKRKRNF